MKIVFFGSGQPEEAGFKNFFGGEVVFMDGPLTKGNIADFKDAEIVSVFVNSSMDKEAIDALPDLKFIAARSVGVNNIDIEYAKKKGIQIANVPGYGSHTVAEFTFGLMLALSRNVIKANDYIRQTQDFNYFPELEGFNLFEKTLGVIGTGKIGKNVIKIAKGFGMKVIACDLYPDENFAKENDFEYKSVEEITGSADIITLHAPYTNENHHLINKERIDKMKKGAFLINTARGELIDTDALVIGLKSGQIGGVALDVLEDEKDLKEDFEVLTKQASGSVYKMILEDRMLMEMRNVIVTPHVAFYTREAVNEILKTTADNMEAFIANKPVNLV